MIRHLCICGVALFIAVLPLRAASGPHAGRDGQTIKVWTNDDLKKLRGIDGISIVGQVNQEKAAQEYTPPGYDVTQNPEWYAEQAARLRDELEYRQEQLREYRQALEDTRSFGASNSGVDLVGADFAITPEAGVEILQQRVAEDQAKLDELEDLARRNDIEPGVLRGQ